MYAKTTIKNHLKHKSMRTQEITIFTFEELTPEAQERAIEKYRSNDHDSQCSDEYKDTLKKFNSIFPVKVRNWQVNPWGYSYCDMESQASDEINDLSGLRLFKYLVNNFSGTLYKRKYLGCLKTQDQPHNRHRMVKNVEISRGTNKGKFYASVYSNCQTEQCCNLTGVYSDESILQPLYDFLQAPNKNTTFADLMEECGNAWASAFSKNMEEESSDEYISEMLINNDYEYTEEGDRY
jgi:hypothetical protein